MNDTAIKNFCIWARRELIEQVAVQARRYGIREDGYDPAIVDAVDGRLLSAEERRQRADLIRRLGSADASDYKDAYEKLIDQAAYTWFNRMVAIRFMELNDRLPSHVRLLSADDGSFRPQVLREALDVYIEGVDAATVSALVAASDDEALFRYLFLAQCRELSSCLPDVFEPVGSAMELLLPEGLLRNGSVLDRLVTDIPEDDWREGVEIVGWMYQYYVSERKREVFDGYQKGKKARREDIPPATQTFTPDWIVRYMVENTLGRTWVLNRPGTPVRNDMRYFISPSGTIEPHPDASNPENLTFCDPCCGSGHILARAFDLLMSMYTECGYTNRDAVRLVLEKNLIGFEIDRRACSFAAFELAMKACEYDGRFLKRGIKPEVFWLEPVKFTEEELALMPMVAERSKLLEAIAHMDECGSLYRPEAGDIKSLEEALEITSDSFDLFALNAKEKLEIVLRDCKALSRQFSIVVTNPPYMGSSNMDKWLSAWVKKAYPATYRDLCTCFVERCVGMLEKNGYTGLATTNSWMFLSSFEKLRNQIIDEHSLLSLVQLSVHGFKGIAAQVCTFVIGEAHSPETEGGFVRLNDFDHHSLQEEKTLEAIANPTCGWFYRRPSNSFKSIPGTPIAYWASDVVRKAFDGSVPLAELAEPRQGLATSDNGRFLRKWWEVGSASINRGADSHEDAVRSGNRWFPIIRGGGFRKWWAITEEVVDWYNDGAEMKEAVLKKYPYLSTPDFVIKNQSSYFKPAVTWSKISSADISFRYAPAGMLFEVAGACMFAGDDDLKYLQALCNSSSMFEIACILSPTLNFEVGQIASYPVIGSEDQNEAVLQLTQINRHLSSSDWNAEETSWGFSRNSLV